MSSVSYQRVTREFLPTRNLTGNGFTSECSDRYPLTKVISSVTNTRHCSHGNYLRATSEFSSKSLTVSVGASPDSDSDSMGESESESGLRLWSYGLGLGLGIHLCGLGLKRCGVGLWSYGLGLGLGLHPGGLGLTVSPGESGEKCTRNIQTFMCNYGRNKGKELIKLLN